MTGVPLRLLEEKMVKKWKTGLVGTTVLAMALAGCVEEEASFVMYGSLVGEGSVELVGEMDDDGEFTGAFQERATCEFPREFDEPDIWAEGYVNLTELALVGQPLVQGTYSGAVRDRYSFQAIFENRLYDGRTVGGVSGGDGGGFSNMELDKSDILVQSAYVGFPTFDNTFVGVDDSEVPFYDGYAVEYERLTSMLVQSGGGVATLAIPLINNPFERSLLEDYLNSIPGNRHTFVAEIQLFGETLGGREVETNVIYYPVDMCSVDWIDSDMLGWDRGDWQDWFGDPESPGWDMSIWEDYFDANLAQVPPEEREAWVVDRIFDWDFQDWEQWMGEQGGNLGTSSWREWTDEASRDWLVTQAVNECGYTAARCWPDS